MPGSSGCPAKSYEETFGFDWCPGDEQVQSFMKDLAAGKNPKYRDPACDLKDPNGITGKQSPCNMSFGTSTGALGLQSPTRASSRPYPGIDLSVARI